MKEYNFANIEDLNISIGESIGWQNCLVSVVNYRPVSKSGENTIIGRGESGGVERGRC